MPVHPTASNLRRRCLHESPQRLVWLRPDPEDGGAEVHKLYLSGATDDAAHEARMGETCAGAGVVPYLGAGRDEESGRPVVRQRFVPGQSLEALALERGALPAARALALVLRVATTLTRLHELRTTAAPRGVCHGDVKPQNLLVTLDDDVLLLDFEHARPVGAAADRRAFTGGTVAWSPPEAHHGANPDASFDVFGLGATLAFLLDGDTSRQVPRHPGLDALVRDCCESEPDRRPSAREVAGRCEQLLATIRDDDAERHLDDWATGACRHRPEAGTDLRTATWFRRERLLRRLPGLLDFSAELPARPQELMDELDAARRALRRFPRSAAALARRRALLDCVARLLAAAPATVQAMHKDEQFEAALRWLRAAEALTVAATGAPGGLALLRQAAVDEEGPRPSRPPAELLAALVAGTEAAATEHATRCAAVQGAQRALDLPRAERCLDELADAYGGTSRTVAEQRDQLHRLGFYLDRIARAASNVERAVPLWNAPEVEPVQQIVAAASASQPLRERSGGAVGLRSLLLTLRSVAEEFPHLEQVAPALEALDASLCRLTDDAWRQLADAEQRLTVVPVPVRPLQLALGRLDTLRALEAFVDRPERPRSDLLDGLERLRLGLEQARSNRDRLTENAEHALARGHWTTGLFDMERAVEGLTAGDESERAEAERLRERLQAARRTKQELEAAIRRNVELNARYASLEDDAHSTSESRLQVLQERRDCLLFLSMHVPSDRAELYRQDLRQVDGQLALERAEDAERRLSALGDPALRLELARETLAALGADDDDGEAPEHSGRTLRLQERWRTIAAQCLEAIRQDEQREAHARRQRRRMITVTVLLAIATTTAIGFAIGPWIAGAPVVAGSK